MAIRVRFAPSPTGSLHVGNARTALFNWLYAKKEGGSFVLRLEDTDLARSTQESIDSIVDDLKWLGLEWDEGYLKGGPAEPYRQSERLAYYKRLAESLVKTGHAYYCYDNEAELEEERQGWLKAHLKKRHPHRDLTPEQRAKFEAEGRKPSIRFGTDELSGQVAFDDLVRGEVETPLDEIRDFNLMKSDGTPMYNFACVADDQAMGITHVLRGEDGISNTPRQILLYGALGWATPRFGHVSFIMGPDGQKLSKRHGSSSVAELKSAGYLPEAVVNYLGLLGMGGHSEGEEIFDLAKLTAMFSPDHLIKKSAIFDFGKLDFLNAHYIRLKTGAELKALCAPLIADLEVPSEAWLIEALEVLKLNARHLIELVDPLESLLNGHFAVSHHSKSEAMVFPSAEAAVTALKASFINEGFPKTAEDAKARYKSAQKASGIKGKDFFMPTRIALTGEAHGPEIVKLIPLIGEERCLKRLDAFLKTST